VTEKWINLFEAAAVVFISYHLIPWVHGVWPDMPSWIPDAGTPVAAALLVGAVSLLLWQRPRITVVWKVRGDPNALNDLRIHLHAPNFASLPFEVSFSGRPKGFLTEILMRWLRARGLILTVEPVGAPVATTVILSSPIDANTSVGAADYRNGFSMKVVAPAQQRTWMWAKVFFESTTEINDTFNLEYGASASTKAAQLLSKLVRVTSAAEDFNIN